MISIRFTSLIAAASMLLSVSAADTPTPTVSNHITTPSVTLPARAIVNIGCFATGVPLENHGDYLFRTPGNCQLVCIEQNKPVFGLSDGNNCWCGDLIPPKDSQIANSTCDTKCPGDGQPGCGGPGVLWVALSGTSLNRIDNYEPKDSSSSSTKTAAPTSTAPASSQTSAPSNEDDKPNTVAIAVGVVVGVVAVAGLCFGVWFFLRKRRQRQAEEDYRRNAANVSNFVNGGKMHDSGSSMNDSRIDPSFMDRRQSNGSIADNEDYSRRILKVTNV